MHPASNRLTWLTLLLVTIASAPAWSHGPTRLVVFGDSLSDPGNYYLAFGQVSEAPFAPIPDAPYDIGPGHHFTDGRTWAERLAVRLDSPSGGLPALARPGEYTNYAVGRARARPDAPVFAAYDLTTQVGMFLGDFHGQAPPGATYIIWIGANDLDDALQALGTDPTGATSAAIVQGAIQTVAANVQVLWSAGARSFLIANLPDLGMTPAVRALGPPAVGAASQITGLYNAGLQEALTQLQGLPQVHFLQFDVNALLDQVIAQPKAFGLDDVVDACLTFFTTTDPVCAQPRRHLFWDGIHPTVAGHEILEEAAQKIIECAALPNRPGCAQ
jgi:phospholipase/lecithinase/hemolysin